MKKQELLILVDNYDQQLGTREKLVVHQLGILHRAFSLFIFNSKGELILQQRANEKYHSAGLWSNTCCSHPKFGEELIDAVYRRLEEEMGIICQVEFAFSFIYKAKLENGLTEHEYDHVFFGVNDDYPKPVKTEVINWKYMNLSNLKKDIKINPQQYTPWLKICLEKVTNQVLKYHDIFQ